MTDTSDATEQTEWLAELAAELSQRPYVAFDEAEYFGGSGRQKATVWYGGEVVAAEATIGTSSTVPAWVGTVERNVGWGLLALTRRESQFLGDHFRFQARFGQRGINDEADDEAGERQRFDA